MLTGDAALATTMAGAGLVAASQVGLGIPCPFLAATGIPCPGCGMTRLAATVASGDVVTAATRDPGGVLLIAVVGLLAVMGLALRAAISIPGADAVQPRRAVRLLGAALAVHWVTTLAGGGFVSA